LRDTSGAGEARGDPVISREVTLIFSFKKNTKKNNVNMLRIIVDILATITGIFALLARHRLVKTA
jgi:hypothetical protein